MRFLPGYEMPQRALFGTYWDCQRHARGAINEYRRIRNVLGATACLEGIMTISEAASNHASPVMVGAQGALAGILGLFAQGRHRMVLQAETRLSETVEEFVTIRDAEITATTAALDASARWRKRAGLPPDGPAPPPATPPEDNPGLQPPAPPPDSPRD